MASLQRRSSQRSGLHMVLMLKLQSAVHSHSGPNKHGLGRGRSAGDVTYPMLDSAAAAKLVEDVAADAPVSRHAGRVRTLPLPQRLPPRIAASGELRLDTRHMAAPSYKLVLGTSSSELDLAQTLELSQGFQLLARAGVDVYSTQGALSPEHTTRASKRCAAVPTPSLPPVIKARPAQAKATSPIRWCEAEGKRAAREHEAAENERLAIERGVCLVCTRVYACTHACMMHARTHARALLRQRQYVIAASWRQCFKYTLQRSTLRISRSLSARVSGPHQRPRHHMCEAVLHHTVQYSCWPSFVRRGR